MLIYVNQFNLIGDNATNRAFNTIAGWLKEKTGKIFSIEQLKSSDEFKLERSTVRTYAATQFEPYMHSVMLTHPDDQVSGRQWVTEIGVKECKTFTQISILLETSDISTQVIEIPMTTRPKLVTYLSKNAELDRDTIGKQLKSYSNTTDSLISLSSEIEREDRSHPIIIISNGTNKKTLINPLKLQEQLFGLAQVVSTTEEIDSWEMERVLTRRYSAWGGAINIIYPSQGRGFCYNRLLLSSTIDEWKANHINVNAQILSIITHTTNGFRKKQHFSPTDVRAKRQKDQRIFLKKKFSELQDDQGFKQLAEDAFSQLDEHEAIIDRLKSDFNEELTKWISELSDEQNKTERLTAENRAKQHQIETLKYQLSQSGNKVAQSETFFSPTEITDILVDGLTPKTSLLLISKLFPNRVLILEDAYHSTTKSLSFKNSSKLLGLLGRLVTEYLDLVLSEGDVKARSLFGAAYSASESETVERTDKYASQRTFDYDGAKVAMFRHLKIGNSRNPDETIRVYFHIDNTKKIIVIGYCGPHLDVVST
ncbi:MULTISPECIES: hypothetical protein [Aeromonas]|uniref:hypothetical protein n=1 Tax=Aeromonas TaxID=642 RepID=UPI001495B061|nr:MULTISPECIES: hypothetical protein [Aeromonas]MBA8782950.1 hypothetical protein [Aeromonas caviae]MBA8787004.1 hypothetical protein [Aeromonas sp. TW 6]